jgi:hypothetical protein
MKTESDGAEDADGEQEDGGDEFEDSGDGDADDAEGQHDQPDDGVTDERNQGERPAEDEQEAKEEEFDHEYGGPFEHRVELLQRYTHGRPQRFRGRGTMSVGYRVEGWTWSPGIETVTGAGR